MPSPEVSELFDPDSWREVDGPGVTDLTDVTYHRHVTPDGDGPVVRVAFDRPKAVLGLQDHTLGETKLWVLPSPSGLNAHYQPADLARLFRELRAAALV